MRLPFDFHHIHFFSRRNPSLPYGCTATKRIFDDSAHFYLSPSHGDAKKVQTEKVKGKCTFLDKDIYESLIFLIISIFKKSRESASGFSAFIYSQFFSPIIKFSPAFWGRRHRDWRLGFELLFWLLTGLVFA